MPGGSRNASTYGRSSGAGWHAHERLAPPETTALIVIDGVPFFVTGSPYARNVIPTSRASPTSWARPEGPRTVLITATVTNVCRESSARYASTLGYRVI